jgi:hypothetical protein
MDACNVKQLCEALNRNDGFFIYAIERWCLYQGGQRRPAVKDRPEGWMDMMTDGIRGFPHDWPQTARGYFCIVIEKDHVQLSHVRYRKRRIRFHEAKDIDDMARRIIRRIRNKEKITEEF